MYSAINLLKCKPQTNSIKKNTSVFIYTSKLINYFENLNYFFRIYEIVCGYPASWIYNNFMIIVDGIFAFNQRIKSTIFVRYHQKLNIFFFIMCYIMARLT